MDAWELLWTSGVKYHLSPQEPLLSVGHVPACSVLFILYFQTLLVSFITGRNKSSMQSAFCSVTIFPMVFIFHC